MALTAPSVFVTAGLGNSFTACTIGGISALGINISAVTPGLLCTALGVG
jgi:hypothetical protein